MTDFIPHESGQPIRMPSTANLFVDSSDRAVPPPISPALPSPWAFTIARPNSILNGYFSRIGLTELQLKWDIPAISTDLSSNVAVIDISGQALRTITFGNSQVITAAAVIDALVTRVNDLSGTTNFFLKVVNYNVSPAGKINWNTQLQGNQKAGGTNGGYFRFNASNLTTALAINNTAYSQYIQPYPDLRPFRYIDFVSRQLTYNQALKDASTNPAYVDVLQRWYFSDDSATPTDKYGFPIYQGYNVFSIRRAFNPPKQILWQPNQPIGQLAFEVYGQLWQQTAQAALYTYNVISIPNYFTTNFALTLQVSET